MHPARHRCAALGPAPYGALGCWVLDRHRPRTRDDGQPTRSTVDSHGHNLPVGGPIALERRTTLGVYRTATPTAREYCIRGLITYISGHHTRCGVHLAAICVYPRGVWLLRPLLTGPTHRNAIDCTLPQLLRTGHPPARAEGHLSWPKMETRTRKKTRFRSNCYKRELLPRRGQLPKRCLVKIDSQSACHGDDWRGGGWPEGVRA